MKQKCGQINFEREEPFFIAEIGCNHNGDVNLAKEMTIAAAETGVDAVKFQTYIPEEFISPWHECFKSVKNEALSFEDFHLLQEICNKNDTFFLSTPFDFASVDFLDSIGIPAFKISSGDVTALPLVEYIAHKQKPIILSIGSCTWLESDKAVDIIKDISKSELVVMHCTTAYPAPDDQANLSLIPKIAQRYNCVTGFSDHTEGIEISLAALALGAQVIEKHFTIDRKLPGGDNEISILPSELKCLIKQGKRVAGALGQDDKIVYPCEKNCNDFARRSLYARVDLPEGSVLTADNILVRRPSGGVPADNYFDCLGKKITRTIKKDMPITLNDIE